MGVTTTQTNKPLNPRGNDQSPLAYNRAKLFSGKALDFDGVNDYVDLDGFTMSGNNYSFAFCLKADAWNNFDYIFDISFPRFIIASQPANNLAIYDGNSWQAFGEINDTTNTNFFTITIEGTISKAYLNGVQFGSTLNIQSRDFSTATECALMMAYDGTSAFFPGKMSGFKAFNTALTAAQVADLYNNPEKVVPTGVDNTALKLWLPMQEGAGTTAYDGSGNGNHGTISGATYTHGIGAPVSQTAVIDWNKGTNELTYSEDFTEWTLEGSASLTSDAITAPSGESNASKLIAGASSARQSTKLAITKNGDLVYSVYAKKGEYDVIQFTDARDPSLYANFDLTNGVVGDSDVATPSIEDAGNGWYRCSISYNSVNDIISVRVAIAESATSARLVDFAGNGSDGVYIWGASLEGATALGSYVETIGTAQTSEVLLPQGLTTGRDITGVNLFENVRKQGALNLDGNSWGKVHPNNSFAFGTGAFSMEAWAKLEYVNTGSYANEIIALNDSDSWAIKTLSTGVSFKAGNTSLSHTQTLDDSWAHIVGVRKADGSMQLYINGVEEESAAAGSSTSNLNTDNPLRLGTDASEGSRTYKDQIAQPRIYNRALTAEEVQRNYNGGKNTYTNS